MAWAFPGSQKTDGPYMGHIDRERNETALNQKDEYPLIHTSC